MEKYLNKKVIIKGESSGLFYGVLVSKNGREVEMTDCRRIYKWEGANTASDISIKGCKATSKLTAPVQNIMVLDAIEIIPCEEKAIEVLDGITKWTF